MTIGTTADREAYVAGRFDALADRFKDRVAPGDARLRAVLAALGPVEGLRVLDLGCGKGRFAWHLRRRGAAVVGLDPSAAMLGEAREIARVRGSARSLPFAAGCFDAAIAIEVFEHLDDLEVVLAELRRVLRPGGTLAIVDKNAAALDARRPWVPSLALKRLDEHRGRWMYPPGAPFRERWFWPRRLAATISRYFERPRVEYLLTGPEAGRWIFQRVPRCRLFALWTARRPGTAMETVPRSDFRVPTSSRTARRPEVDHGK